MTSKKYLIYLIGAMVIAYCIHFTLLATEIIQYNWIHFNVLDGVVFFLFLGGAIIMLPNVKKEPEKFVMSFMTLTTVQLLAALAVMAAIVYTKQHPVRPIVFSVLGLFSFMLIIQSVLLVSFTKGNK